MIFCIIAAPSPPLYLQTEAGECFRWIPWLISLLLSYLNEKWKKKVKKSKKKKNSMLMPHKRRKKKNIKSHKIAYTARNCSVVYGWWNPSAHVLWAALLFSLPLSHSDWLICLLLIVCLSIIYYTSSSLLLFFFVFLMSVREGEREREATAN